jgi:uncharacterized protein with NRDE domain
MCVIIFAWQFHPDYSLIVAANRDEFYARETRPASRWEDDENILAGRDLVQGGTWLGISEDGRFAAVTNYRQGSSEEASKPLSRGYLTTEFLKGTADAQDFLRSTKGEDYGGYSLIVGNVKTDLWWESNHANGMHQVEPGIHGLSNHLMDSPWPKVENSKQLMKSLLNKAIDETSMVDGLFEILANRDKPDDDKLPDTGVSLAIERELSSMFVTIPEHKYGTRSSTVVLFRRNGHVRFVERSFDSGTVLFGQTEHCLQLSNFQA